MNEKINLRQRAKAVPYKKKKVILMSIKETSMHLHLKELFSFMARDSVVEITHGVDEFGKDLVMVKKEPWGQKTTAIIVHKGNIKAKTIGNIEKINSQIKQAFEHPAKLKTILEDLTVSEVLVIIVGVFSLNAKERILKEIKSPNIYILDINWLINKFTDHYPQVFFQGRLIDFIEKKIEEFEICHLFTKRGKNLSECYVEPLIDNISLPSRLDEKSLVKIMKARRMPFSQFRTIVNTSKEILLIGSPGTGKTLALSKIMLTKLKEASSLLIEGDYKEKLEIPLFIQANKFYEFDECNELIKYFAPEKEIHNRLKINLIMIDGLDEVLHDKRNEVIKKATKFCEKLNCSLIISSRKIEFIQTLPQKFKIYELLPFEFGQALKLFHKLITDNKLLSTLKDGLKGIQYQILMTPLSLMLLIELVESYKEIPASITELYERFTDSILGRFDKEKGIEVLFDYLIKKRFLEEFTFKEFYQKNRLEVPIEDFNKFLNEYSKRYGWKKNDLENFIKEIDRAGIIGNKVKIIFLHRSFLDYFIALYIFDKREQFSNLSNLITKLHFDDVWADVAFFYIGMKREIDKSVLTEIFAYDKKDLVFYFDKLMAGRLLQAGWHSDTDTKFYGISNAVKQIPIIRKKLSNLIPDSQKDIPRIILDLLVLTLCEFSLSSTFLLEESQKLFNNHLKKPNQSSAYTMLLLLWSHARFLTLEEIQDMINNILEVLAEIPNPEEEAKILMLLISIEKKNEALTKAIEKKIKKLVTKHPGIFKKLFPRRRKGFR